MSAPEICDYEDSSWRTDFWPGREYEDRVERVALTQMLPPRGTRLCEIGAGFGRLADYYRGYEQVILLDYSRSMLRDAVERLHQDPRFVFVAADLYHLPLADSSFDTLVTVRVLHHVAEIPRAFSEIARVLRPQGTYLTEFANKRHAKAILRYWLTHRPPNPFTREPYEFVKLNFDFHPRYIHDQLSAVNLVVRDKRAVSILRMAWLKRVVPPSILASVDGLVQRPISRLQISPSLFYRTQSNKPGDLRINSVLWRCPVCDSSEISQSSDGLLCRACTRAYPIADGIIDFKSQL